jgi:xyloglucan-specific exo-beta-1,4-glucanase
MKTMAKKLKTMLMVFVLLSATTISIKAQQAGIDIAINAKQKSETTESFFNFEKHYGTGVGRFQSVTFDPINEGVIYASGYEGRHIFKSVDNGSTWSVFYTIPRVIIQEDYRTYSLKFANTEQPTHLYFVGEVLGSVKDSYRGLYILDVAEKQIVKEIKIINNDDYVSIKGYDVCKANPERIILNVSSRKTPYHSIWLSNDGGNSFDIIFDYNNFSFSVPQIVRFNPVNSDIVYAGIDHYSAIMKYSIANNNWSTVYNHAESNIRIADIAFDPNNSDLAYATTNDFGANIPGILKSSDGGNTWNQIETNIELEPVFQNMFDKIGINPETSEVWVTYENIILSSADGGANWQSLTFPADELLYSLGYEIAYNPFNTDHVLILTNRRVVETTNGGESFNAMPVPFSRIATLNSTVFPNDDKYIYYTTRGAYFAENVVTGETSSNTSLMGTGMNYVVNGDSQIQDRVFISKTNNSKYGVTQIFLSEDNLQTEPVYIFGTNQIGMKSFASSPSNPDTYWFVLGSIGAQNLWKATNNFSTLENKSISGYEQDYSGLIVIIDNGVETIWTGFNGLTMKGVFKSIDGGDTWEMRNNGLPFGADIRDIAISPFDQQVMLATASMYWGIYMTTNGGGSWFNVHEDNELSKIKFSTKQEGLVVAQKHGRPGFLFSVDGGYTWLENPAFDLLDADYLEMELIDHEDYASLFFSTSCSGVHEYSLSIPPVYSLKFIVEDEDGEFIPDAQIKLNGIEYSKGKYDFDVYPYTYYYTVTCDSLPAVNGYVTITDSDVTVYIVIKEDEDDNVYSPHIIHNSISIYPNPATSQLIIMSGETINEIFVYDLQGRIIYSNKIQSFEYTFNVSNLNNGMYFIKILTSGNKVITRKFQVNK